ncbi:hypothetical protein GUJ93_ZPchr0010g9607 [Zizania palustris]|uniref:DUF3741 domain-containing protein n=1 Tax=Zizania palustris TaxID=103762 RepID=A0A8J6BJC8_ZIZPA|nr:hypothetical protein GUJ93_ZPchr0010g9607 [Zizania palustris]
MKNGNSASAPQTSAGGNSLAITERQKPAPSCVAALFQMLAKRKLFSSSSKKNKLLPPVRAQKFSPPTGGEKTPANKLRILMLESPYYPNEVTSRLPTPGHDNNCREMCNAGVVARLMGLSSMPATSHQKAARAMDTSEIGGHRNECPQGLPDSYGSIDNSHRKQQKQGQLIDGRHDSANQFNADVQPLWSRRHAHKVASPIKSPRSISSRNKARLIEAAVRVLEPGLQSRCHHQARRHARLEYTCNSSGVQSASAAIHNFSDQFSREMCDVYAPRSGAQNQWSEEDTKRNASVGRSNQIISCQAQSEVNRKDLHVSSSKKAGFKDSAPRISDAILDTNQGVQKIKPKSISRENVACSPLKQNNLKQNALPVPCRAADPGHMVQRQKHRTAEQNVANKDKEFVCLNRSMNNGASLRSKGKVMDKTSEPHNSTQKKNLSTKCHRTNGMHGDHSNKLKLKTATPKATEKGTIIAKGAGLVSEKPMPTRPNSVRNDSRRQVEPRSASRGNSTGIGTYLLNGHTKGSDSVVLGSPTGSCPKRHSPRDGQNSSFQRELVLKEALQGISNLETAESIGFNRNGLKNRDFLGGRVTSLLFEKTSVVPLKESSTSDEFLWECNIVDSLTFGFRDLPTVELRGTHKMHEATTNSGYPSHYADECISGSPPDTAAEAEFRDPRLLETCTQKFSIQDATTKRNFRCAQPNSGQDGAHLFEPAHQDSKLIHPGEVAATVELVLTNICRSTKRASKVPLKAFLVQTIDSALASLTKSFKNSFTDVKATEGNPLGNLAFDSVMECLDSMCIQLSNSGYRSFSKLALVCNEERLTAEVNKEIARSTNMAGKALDDLIASDVMYSVEASMSTLQEAFQIGVQIERDLLQELVAEIGRDMLKHL